MPSVPSARSKRKWAFEEVKFSLRESNDELECKMPAAEFAAGIFDVRYFLKTARSCVGTGGSCVYLLSLSFLRLWVR